MTGAHTEQVGKYPAELCMERGIRIAWRGHAQTRGQMHCGVVHRRGGQAHGGAVQQTREWCEAGPNTEQVGKCLAELCIERGVMITRPGRAQTGGQMQRRGRTRNGRARSRRGHARKGPGSPSQGSARNVQRTRGRATDKRVVCGGAEQEQAGKCTVEPCTERAEKPRRDRATDKRVVRGASAYGTGRKAPG